MRPVELVELWQNVGAIGLQLPTVEFYGHDKGHYRSFSNFYEHAPFEFTVPAECGRDALIASGRSATIPVSFTEKAIMLCKAAAMGDYASYDKIARVHTPGAAKRLGRSVAPWDDARWKSVVCSVALAAVGQKFAAFPHLATLLLGTGNHVIAEMAPRDANWGTGLDIGHSDASRPERWRGTNVLGWALIVTRTRLRDAPQTQPAAAATSASDAAALAEAMSAAAAAETCAAPQATPPPVDQGARSGHEAAAADDAHAAPAGNGKAERKGRKARRAGRLQDDWLRP